MKNRNSYLYYSLMVVVIIYAIGSITHNIVAYTHDSIMNIILTVVMCTTFAAILFIVAKINWEHGQIDLTQEELAKINNQDESKDTKTIDSESESTTPPEKYFSLKKLLISLVFFAIFAGIGIGVIYFGATRQAEITGKSYIKTTATIKYVVVDEKTKTKELRYVFTDENKNQVAAKYASGFVGVTPSEGNRVTIYYSRKNPENIQTLCLPIMAYLIGALFIAISILAVLLNFGFNKCDTNPFAPILIGTIFAGLAITMFTALKVAIGGAFFSLVLSGGGLYLIGCFGLLGMLFLLIGIWDTIVYIVKAIKSKMQKNK